MRPLTQVAGLWRVGSFICAMKYASTNKEKLRWIGGALNDSSRTEYTLTTPMGTFLCPDVASAYQFLPSWEVAVKAEITKLHDGVFVDIGANIGFYSVMAVKKGNFVISVEPNFDAYRCLILNLASATGNVFSEYSTFLSAAWDSRAKLLLRTSENTDISEISDEGEKVEAYPADSFMRGRKPDLIKIDVEGSEFNVLLGLKQTIAFHHPKIIFEALTPEKLDPCRRLLKERGYQVTKLDSTNYLAT